MRRIKGPTQNQIVLIKRGINVALIILLLVMNIIFSLDWFAEKKGTWSPDYPRVDLEDILDKKELSEEDYHTLLMQTGLGQQGIDELFSKKVGDNRKRAIEKYQNGFFSPKDYECRRAAIIVNEERLRDKNGNLMKGFEMPSLKNGDILITKATHSIGWRHGHAAIVTNAVTGETLEAIILGNPSVLQDISKWQTYPSFILLRLKDNALDANVVAEYAKKNILGIPYGLLAGIPEKAPDEIKITQCSHLVWFPYEHFGYDLDSDGSWLVTPKDISNSDLLEVVQVYGVNPEEIWP